MEAGFGHVYPRFEPGKPGSSRRPQQFTLSRTTRPTGLVLASCRGSLTHSPPNWLVGFCQAGGVIPTPALSYKPQKLGNSRMAECKYCGQDVDARGVQSHEHWCEENPDSPVHDDVDDEPADDVDDDPADPGDDWEPTPAGGADPADDPADDVDDDPADDVDDDEYWCANCGADLEYLEKPCPECGETPAWSQIA